MLKNLKTKVIEVKEAPAIKHLDTLSGIRDAKQAEAWGMKYGYPVAYFMARKQRVYADKLSARVDEKAKKLEDDAQKLALEVELLR
jgi:hypothetical protein